MECQAVFLVLVLLSVVHVGCQHPSLPDPAFLLPYSCVFQEHSSGTQSQRLAPGIFYSMARPHWEGAIQAKLEVMRAFSNWWKHNHRIRILCFPPGSTRDKGLRTPGREGRGQWYLTRAKTPSSLAKSPGPRNRKLATIYRKKVWYPPSGFYLCSHTWKTDPPGILNIGRVLVSLWFAWHDGLSVFICSRKRNTKGWNPGNIWATKEAYRFRSIIYLERWHLSNNHRG